MLTCTITETLEIVVEAVNPMNGFLRRLDCFERQHVAEESGIDVLLARRRGVKIEVARNQSCALQDLRDVAGSGRHLPHNLRDVCHTAFIERDDLLLLGARLFLVRSFVRPFLDEPSLRLFRILKLHRQWPRVLFNHLFSRHCPCTSRKKWAVGSGQLAVSAVGFICPPPTAYCELLLACPAHAARGFLLQALQMVYEA